jgi:hypothetical protein
MTKREETVAEREWHELEAELLGRPRDNATKKKTSAGECNPARA